LNTVGLEPHIPVLNIILPVGISFYTFQTMSYTIDIYRKRLQPTTRFFDFALYVAFFPQLVAGPIERARHLLPQILEERHITYEDIRRGCFLIYWGLFQKVVVADNLAKVVDYTFGNSISNGPLVLISLYAFAFQIYGDFAGYSNIAIGVSRCMGFDIMTNFRYPYFSKTPSEFWQRWHISLSSWLRDYLYIPLGGNRNGKFRTFQNLTTTMLLGGLWHGANYTFVLWGGFHGVLLVAYRVFEKGKYAAAEIQNSFFSRGGQLLQVVIFFHLVCLGWLFFRAQWLSQAKDFGLSLIWGWGHINPMTVPFLCKFIIFALPLWVAEFFQWRSDDVFYFQKKGVFIRIIFYAVTGLMLFGFGASGEQFIYFQF
jgi:D-alanyl-lipoteichoic acid acyltransferase DltB (MBOAT superfamily)